MRTVTRSSFSFIRTALGVSLLIGVAACGSSETPNTGNDDGREEPGEEPVVGEDGAFESSAPLGADSDARASGGDDTSLDGAETSGDPGAAPPASEPSAGQSDSPERAIEEADIIKLDGNRLYALSRYGGLSVIDVSDPSRLRSLGHHQVMAAPFEMYVRDGVAMVLYNGYGQYDYDEAAETWTWYQTSYVVALDASSPANIDELGRFPVGGYISDSRIVGDILYVAAFEDGYCWQCDQGPRTNLMSLDVSNPSGIVLVDELSFEEPENTYGWKKSMSSTDQRLYIAGPAWGATEEPEGSLIQVVDISDREGDMQLGAAVEVGGQIESRWQMDEHEGVLRVISQPFTWRTDMVPVIETFEIESSSSITPLGSLAMVLPRPERLQTVRFDGDRAYAITFEQTDPLFTIDLREPAAPVQAGELEMPGWVYYLAPYGERVLGLGFDQGNPEGALTVSLFDVSDLSTPLMLDRVNFGGEWGEMAEDQDRIHKAFNVMQDENLILVPFSGWSYETEADSCGYGRYQSGVQLVDWDSAADALNLRGVAPARGQARRGFMHNEALFTMSDDRLEAFDIDDRDAPSTRDSVALALRVDQAAGSGDTIVRVGYDWWTGVAEVTTTDIANVGAFDGAAELELPQLNQESCNGYSWLSEVRSGDGYVFFVYQEYNYDTNVNTSRIVSVDVSDASAPVVAGDSELEFAANYYYGWVEGLVATGQGLISDGNTLVFSHHENEYDTRGNLVSESFRAKVLDMSEPANPVTNEVEMPLGRGTTGLLIDDGVVATSHFETSPQNPDRVRFYLDRIDVSDPRNPELMEPVSIPGSLLAYDAASERAITVDYRELTSTTTEQECYETEGGWFEYPGTDYQNYDYETTEGTCHSIQQTLRLVEIEDDRATLLGSHQLARGEHVGRTALGDDRLFIALNSSVYYGGRGYANTDDIAVGGYGYSSFASGKAELVVVSGLASGNLETARIQVDTGENYYGYLGHLVAVGQRALVAAGWQGKLSVIDASDATAPSVVRDVDVFGYVQDLDVVGNVAVASMGTNGVQTIRIDD